MRHTITSDDKFVQMTQTPVERLVMRLALPSMLSMLITSVYNMADTYFVGQLGTRQTAAVGVIFSLMSIIQALGFLFGHGSGNFMSRRLGAQDTDAAGSMATTGFVSSLLAGALVTVLGFTLLHPMVRVMGATETIAPYAEQYAAYILAAAPFMTASFTLNNQLRYQGNAFFGMIALCTGAILNIALDPLFIFTLDMGVSGAALATAVSQVVGFILLVWGTTQGGSMRVNPLKFKPVRRQYREIVRGGMPSLWRQGLQALAVIALNHAAKLSGDEAIAAFSIVMRITGLLFASMLGFGQGFQPVCGFNYGAALYPRVKRAFRFSVTAATGVLLAVCAACFIFSGPIVSLFRRDDAEVIRIGAQALRYQLIPYPLLGFTTLAAMMTQTIGRSARASVLAAARQGIFFFPLILALPPLLGLEGVMLTQPAADVLAFILSVWIIRPILKEMSARTTGATDE
jgi:putative MATE family efflux protein